MTVPAFREIVDLSHEFFDNMINLGANHCAFWPLEMFAGTRHLSQGRVAMSGRMILMAEHCPQMVQELGRVGKDSALPNPGRAYWLSPRKR